MLKMLWNSFAPAALVSAPYVPAPVPESEPEPELEQELEQEVPETEAIVKIPVTIVDITEVKSIANS